MSNCGIRETFPCSCVYVHPNNSCWSDRLWWPSIGNHRNVKLWNKHMQESFPCCLMWVSYVTIWDLHLRRQFNLSWLRDSWRMNTRAMVHTGSFFKLIAPIIPWLRISVLGANVRMYGVEPEEGNKICLTIKCITSCNSTIMKGGGSHKGCLIDTHTVL